MVEPATVTVAWESHEKISAKFKLSGPTQKLPPLEMRGWRSWSQEGAAFATVSHLFPVSPAPELFDFFTLKYLSMLLRRFKGSLKILSTGIQLA